MSSNKKNKKYWRYIRAFIRNKNIGDKITKDNVNTFILNMNNNGVLNIYDTNIINRYFNTLIESGCVKYKEFNIFEINRILSPQVKYSQLLKFTDDDWKSWFTINNVFE